jgi:hypothetical protein
MLTKEQAAAVADQLIAAAEIERNKKALARLAVRGGKLPPGVSLARFAELVPEAERRVARSWKLLCPVAAAIGILLALYDTHVVPVMIGFIPCALSLLTALRRKLIQSYIRTAARVAG